METTKTMPIRAKQSAADKPYPEAQESPPTLLLALFRVMGMLFILFLVFTLICIGIYGYFQISDAIIPGIWIEDLHISGLTQEQAAEAIDLAWNQDAVLTLVDSDNPSRRWQTTPQALGIKVDAQATSQAAFAYGHKPDPLMSLFEIILSYQYGMRLEPVIQLDEAKAQKALASWAEKIDLAPTEGQISIQRDTVIGANGKQGKRLDSEQTFALIAADPKVLYTYGFLPLATIPTSPAIGDVSTWVEEAERLIHSHLALSVYDPVRDKTLEWRPSPEKIGSWVMIQKSGDGFHIALAMDEVKSDLAGWIAALGEERILNFDEAWRAVQKTRQGESVEPLIIHYQSTTLEVEPWQMLTSIAKQVGMPYWKIMEFNPSLGGPGMVRVETLKVPPRDVMLTLPVISHKRITINLSEQHLWVYQDGGLIRDFPVSTGIASSPTLPGIYQIKSHYINAYASNWDLYMPHFMGIYDAVPGFENGIHGLPLLSSGVRLWASVLGSPASYGCIVLDLQAAEWLYHWADEGVVVEIMP
jgi:lipoprotein-anchoring transpeptidase ErfK/SrfK